MGSNNHEATIVWHLGFQKTGTTSIQKFLITNRDTLNEDVELFIKGDRRGRRDRTCSLRRWGSAIVEPRILAGPNKFGRFAFEKAIMQISKSVLAHPRKVGLVSDENVLGRYIWRAEKSIFEKAAQLLPMVAAAAQPANSRFVMYTRDFQDWLASAWAQEVKRRSGTESLDEWSARLPFEREWKVIERQLSLALGSSGATVELRDMMEDIEEGLPLGGGLLHSLGINDQKIRSLVRPPHANQRLSSGAIEFLLEVNRANLNGKSHRIVRNLVVKNRRHFSDGE